MWEVTYNHPEHQVRHGFLYDSSLMDADRPYRLAIGTRADDPTIVELPVHWSLDDWEPYAYLPGITGSGVISHPRDVMERWLAELEALDENGSLFVMTSHPFLSGRPSRAAELERLIVRAQELGAWIATCGQIASYAGERQLEAIANPPHDLDQAAPGTSTTGLARSL
jgi:peptidoglycan/xylan/chitin deacetylase (PgdA/CDA1 family)